jgi:hypothetical protein
VMNLLLPWHMWATVETRPMTANGNDRFRHQTGTKSNRDRFLLSIDVLWLTYLFFTSFRLSVYSLQRVDCNESDARFTITYTVYTKKACEK